ncbi:MAG: hypothetical protein NTY22_07615, partial [Proteobacteria bacterium]|nr:hypothetical protein [Pseudomonadota bacterium]
MRFSIAIIFLIIFVVLSGQAWSRVLATVGQENITTEDINKIKQQLKTDNPSFAASISSDEILNQLIDIKVGLMDARLAGMDQLREAKDAMDAALFNYYRAVKVDNIYKNKKFSKKEI